LSVGRVWAAALIMLLAAAARIIGADGYPLWTDEGWSVWAASGDWLAITADDRHPPLYFGLLALWRQIAGESRLALRFPSIVFGLLTVAAVYRLGADARGHRAGMVAALGMAALPMAVYYSQEIRHYGLLTLWAALSWLTLFRLLARPSWRRWLAYALTVCGLVYTLYFGVFILLAQGAALLLSRRRWWGLSALAAAGAAYLPWLIVIVTRQIGFLAVGIGANPGTLRLPDGLWDAARLLFGGAALIGAAAWGAGVRDLAGHPPRWGALIGGAGLPLGLIALGWLTPLLAPRVLIMLVPMLMVAIGAGLRRAPVWLAAVWAGLLLAAPSPPVQPRLPIDQAAAVVVAGYQPGDGVILETGWDDNAAAYEVRRAVGAGAAVVRMLAYLPPRPDAPPPALPPAAEIVAPFERVWVIHWLTAPHVRPYLDAGADGWTRLSAAEVSALPYGAGFNAPSIYVGLYVREA
jgi:mannosyltransferase